jgi:hypothetical protein
MHLNEIGDKFEGLEARGLGAGVAVAERSYTSCSSVHVRGWIHNTRVILYK